MPYIDRNARNRLLSEMERPKSPGELNYLITILIQAYLDEMTMGGVNPLRYQYLNDALGALEGAKQEFYRRVVVPYEDTKITENGDVYT